MTEEQYAEVVGRITALDILARITLTAIAGSGGKGNEIATLNQLERDTFATLQFGERDVTDFGDMAWEKTIEAVREHFAGARSRHSKPTATAPR